MSGTTIPYGDRPITREGFATPEFLQFLERLTKAANKAASGGGGTLQTQITANATSIDALEAQVATLDTQVDTAQATADAAQAYASAIANRRPAEAFLASTGAIALTSGTPVEILQAPVNAGLYVMVGMVCLTGTGSVTLARASFSMATATIEIDPGSFATGWFGAGASPSTLGADLTIGSFMRVMNVVHVATVPTIAYLNVNASFTGAISGYGSLIVWPLGA